MAKLKPILIDGEVIHVGEKSNATVIDTFSDGHDKAVSVTGFNTTTGTTEVITREEARRKPLSDYSDIQTNHTEAIRG